MSINEKANNYANNIVEKLKNSVVMSSKNIFVLDDAMEEVRKALIESYLYKNDEDRYNLAKREVSVCDNVGVCRCDEAASLDNACNTAFTALDKLINTLINNID